MADFAYVACPACARRFMVGEEFFRIAEAYCHCPFCAHEFNPTAQPESARSDPGPGSPADRSA